MELIAAAREIMISTRYCALITTGRNGRAHARAMDAFAPEEDMTVWLATNPQSRKGSQRLNKRPFDTGMSKSDDSRQKLIAILQLAYSGELAAAHAYRGHWHSVGADDERDSIRAIEEDEWRHRKLVGEMLAALGSAPNKTRETRAKLIGRTLGLLCHVTGWLAPMYGAGKLESRNIVEYETAARFARDCGQAELVDCLLEMAEVEWDHEKYFRSQVLSHALGRRLPIWSEPPPKESIRRSFEDERFWSAAA